MRKFALIDCNNFYVSCERVFNPALQNKPTVILSNNDGCIVSRSEEAKQIGIPMGAPYFKYQSLLQEQRVAVFSSNYALYGDMSNRVMETLRQFCPDIEVYSIDEAFLRWEPTLPHDLFALACLMRKQVLQWTGIPVSIGLAATKTLAKIASEIAKKHTVESVFDIDDEKTQNDILATMDVKEIWGISYGWGKRLQEMGLHTALQFKQSDISFIRRHFGVVGERIARELNGQSCLDLETMGPRKNIMFSRSFGRRITKLQELEEAIADYTARAAEKMRRQHSVAQALHLYIATSRHHQPDARYTASTTIGFSAPSNHSSFLIKQAQQALKQIFKPTYLYKKAGVTLLGLVPENQPSPTLFSSSPTHSSKLMQVMDDINQHFGRGKLFLAAQGTKRPWQMRCDLRSPCYTTNWRELLQV